MIDANGQQFYLLPVNNFGSRGRSNERNQRGQVRGRTGGRFNGRSDDAMVDVLAGDIQSIQVFLMLIVWKLLLYISLKIR